MYKCKNVSSQCPINTQSTEKKKEEEDKDEEEEDKNDFVDEEDVVEVVGLVAKKSHHQSNQNDSNFAIKEQTHQRNSNTFYEQTSNNTNQCTEGEFLRWIMGGVGGFDGSLQLLGVHLPGHLRDCCCV